MLGLSMERRSWPSAPRARRRRSRLRLRWRRERFRATCRLPVCRTLAVRRTRSPGCRESTCVSAPVGGTSGNPSPAPAPTTTRSARLRIAGATSQPCPTPWAPAASGPSANNTTSATASRIASPPMKSRTRYRLRRSSAGHVPDVRAVGGVVLPACW